MDQEAFEDAIAVYDQILAMDPTSQRAAIFRAISQFHAGQVEESIENLEPAIQMRPLSPWAAPGLYWQARACVQAGCQDVTQHSIQFLKNHFPESPWATRAEVIEAELAGADAGAATAALNRETEAAAMYEVGMQAAAEHDNAQALAIFRTVAQTYPDTRTGIAARRSEAHVLSRDISLTRETMQAFVGLRDTLQQIAPQSEAAFIVRKCVGALHQRQDMRREAMLEFSALAAEAGDPYVVADASLQAVGAHNEMLQRQYMVGQGVSDAAWEALRQECAAIKQLPQATLLQKSRADLIVAESLHWQKRSDEALAAAEAHIAAVDEATDLAGVATAHLIAGECLQVLRRHGDALVHYRWIADRFGDGPQEIWPGLADQPLLDRPIYCANMPRVYYRIFDALRRGGAAPDEVAAAAGVVLSQYADSPYAELVRLALSADMPVIPPANAE